MNGSLAEPESDPLPAMRGGKGLAHTNRASGSGLHWKTVEEIRQHSMNLIKNGTCRNDFCASAERAKVTTLIWGLTSLMNSVWSSQM